MTAPVTVPAAVAATPATAPASADTALKVTTDVSAAGKIILAGVAVLVPGAGEIVAIVSAILALAPIAEPEVETLIALLKSKAPGVYAPITPGIVAGDAALLAGLPAK